MHAHRRDTPDASAFLSVEERRVLDRLVQQVVRLRLELVAILFLESVRPLNFVGSQALHFFAPLVQIMGRFQDYEILAAALENRRSIDYLLEALENHEIREDAEPTDASSSSSRSVFSAGDSITREPGA
jgi:hypothetical protein